MSQKHDNAKTMRLGSLKASSIKDALILRAFTSICDDAISVAVDEHNFDNQTGNLEESYGYAVYHNGIMVAQKVEGASEGASSAIDFLNGYQPKKKWECVVIAGADYASNLEGYIRRSNGRRSQAGDMLWVLNDSFNFVVQESKSYFR